MLHSQKFLGPQPAALRSPGRAFCECCCGKGLFSPWKNEFLLVTYQVQVVKAHLVGGVQCMAGLRVRGLSGRFLEPPRWQINISHVMLTTCFSFV